MFVWRGTLAEWEPFIINVTRRRLPVSLSFRDWVFCRRNWVSLQWLWSVYCKNRCRWKRVMGAHAYDILPSLMQVEIKFVILASIKTRFYKQDNRCIWFLLIKCSLSPSQAKNLQQCSTTANHFRHRHREWVLTQIGPSSSTSSDATLPTPCWGNTVFWTSYTSRGSAPNNRPKEACLVLDTTGLPECGPDDTGRWTNDTHGPRSLTDLLRNYQVPL